MAGDPAPILRGARIRGMRAHSCGWSVRRTESSASIAKPTLDSAGSAKDEEAHPSTPASRLRQAGLPVITDGGPLPSER
jgi:hypothetical protein